LRGSAKKADYPERLMLGAILPLAFTHGKKDLGPKMGVHGVVNKRRVSTNFNKKKKKGFGGKK